MFLITKTKIRLDGVDKSVVVYMTNTQIYTPIKFNQWKIDCGLEVEDY